MARNRTRAEISLIVTAMGLLMTIVQTLLELVRQKGGAYEDIYRLATPDGKGLLDQIADLIVAAGRRTVNAVKVTVDYTQSLADMIKAGRYNWVNKDITFENFPINGKGKVDLDIIIVHLGRFAETEEVEAELERRGLRAAKIEELLALGEACPDLQREFPIVALGSCWRDRDGLDYVAALYGGDHGRCLHLGCCRIRWDDRFRFAAVRK